AGGPIGKLRDGDRVQVVIDRGMLAGTVDLVGDEVGVQGPDWGTAELKRRPPRPDLAPDPGLPADTRLWAALQNVSGGVWGGCVAGPAVSFSGSPTVSPVTLALCFSECLPVVAVFGSSSIIFLALSQAPPALDMNTARSWPDRIMPAKNPPRANGPRRNPTN